MSFIRVKNIGKKGDRKYRYAYLVENRWRKRLKKGKKGSRQKVSRYLGKVVKLEKVREREFEAGDMGEYVKRRKSQIIRDLVRHELLLRGFEEEKGRMIKEGMIFELGPRKFVKENGEEEKLVIEMNEGFLCKYTLTNLLNFKAKDDDEREVGIKLAKAFLEAGLNVPKEIFVAYFEKV
jgi:hypothetical protein